MKNREKIYFETDYPEDQVHIHSEMEILYILQGHCAVFVNGKNFVMKPEDLVVFNPFEAHQTYREEGGHVLSLFIPIQYLTEAEIRTVFCASALQPEKEVSFDMLRGRLAEIFRDYTDSSAHRRLNLYAELLELFSILQQDFSLEDCRESGYGAKEQKKVEQRQKVLSYIWEHYMEPLTLKSVAAEFYLSEGYFSRLFQEMSGKSFSDYLRSVRLSAARRELLRAKSSVTETAFSCGFGNVNTFIEAFHREYGLTPGTFLQQEKQKSQEAEGEPAEEEIYFAEEISYMSLLRYRTSETKNNFLHLSGNEKIEVDFTARASAFHPIWKMTTSGSYAKELLYAVVQEIFQKVKKEIRFENHLLHGIYEDELGVCHRKEDGSLGFNFVYLDMILKFLVEELQVTPWIVLDYTPSCLVVKRKKRYFGSHVINLPENIEEWTLLVTETLKHMAAVFGIVNASSWKFSMEQAIQVSVGNCDMEEYKAFYLATYRAIKAVLPDAEIFGFGLDTGFVALDSNTEFEELLAFAKEHDCLPDILSFQCFFCDYSKLKQTEVDFDMALDEVYPLSENLDILSEELDQIQKVSERFGVSIPIYIMVVNAGMWGRGPGNDTCFKAAFTVRNALKNRDRLIAYGTGAVIDHAQSLLPTNSMYHGGFAMITFNGIPKAAYEGLLLLNELEGGVIGEGEDYIITRTENGREFYILLYHYCSYNLARHRRTVLSPAEERNYDRYYEYEEKGAKPIRIFMRGLPSGKSCFLETHYVNREHGSSYDVWMKMGAPVNPNRKILDYLMSRSGFEIETEDLPVSLDGTITLSILLEPHEVRVIHGVLE